MPEGGFSGVGHSVGWFRGSGASRGFLWLLGGSALLGGFGRSGVGESVGNHRRGVGRITGGLGVGRVGLPYLKSVKFISGIFFHLTGSRER
jgi:hypothetical protein